MQIALFGGTFDPPHQGHQFITQQMLERGVVDAVWFVPVQNHPFHKTMSSAEDRVNMLELMMADLTSKSPDLKQNIRIERYELDHPAVSYSFDTLTALSAKYPEHTFSWVIGSDNLESFSKWHDYKELLQKFCVYVYPRHGFSAVSLQTGMIFLDNLPEVTVSATEIRQKVQKGESIASLVAPEVKKYIFEHGLYQARV